MSAAAVFVALVVVAVVVGFAAAFAPQPGVA